MRISGPSFLQDLITVILLFAAIVMDSNTSTASQINAKTRAALFDVDGTLSDSFRLGFESTQRVLTSNGNKQEQLPLLSLALYSEILIGHRTISEEEYHQGTRYTTPARLNWHCTGTADELGPIGVELGRQFDELYVKLVSTQTAPLYSGIKGDNISLL